MADSQQQDAQNINDVIMQLRYLQSLYTQQYETLNNSIASYTLNATSLQRNIDLLEKASKVENSNILVSGEGGSYVSAKIGKVESVMTYVGGGYLVEKTIDGALTFMKSNQKRGEEVMNRMISDKQKLEGELIDIDYKLNSIQYQLQQQQGQQK